MRVAIPVALAFRVVSTTPAYPQQLAGPIASGKLPVRVTDTDHGQALARDFSARRTAAGQFVPVSSLEVWQDGDGYLVAPADTQFGVNNSPDNEPVLIPLTADPPKASQLGTHRTTGMVEPNGSGWSWVADDCFARYSDTWSWLDHCYQLYEYTGNPSHDYWELLRYGTAANNSPWVINAAYIGASPTGSSSTQYWVQWSPLGDRTGSCAQATIQITSPVIGVSWPVTECETWDISKGTAGGSFGLTWEGAGTRGSRGLAFAFSVKAAKSAFVQWSLPGYSYGSAF